ncbi:MAG: hypothetical protein AABN33_04495 [Acidobacteriota bacterium]
MDHIVPEALLTRSEELERVLREYDLGLDFDIQDYCNWLPSHSRCNLKKGETLFERGAVLYFVSIARSKATTAREEEERFVKNQKKDRLLGRLQVALEEGLVSRDEVIAALQAVPASDREGYEPIVITFGLGIDRVLRSRVIPETVEGDYSALCDWLEADLVRQLESLLSSSFYFPEASERTGETLSVRLAFLDLDLAQLTNFQSQLWEILEIAYYYEVYGVLPS